MKNSRQELMGLFVKGADDRGRVFTALTQFTFFNRNFANSMHPSWKNLLDKRKKICNTFFV